MSNAWSKISTAINDLVYHKDIKEPKELELKYIAPINIEDSLLLDKAINLFIDNGFQLRSTTYKLNNDKYFDTRQLDLYHKGKSLRIRQDIQDDKFVYKGTYKKPLNENEAYIARNEFEITLPDAEFNSLVTKMKETGALIAFDTILNLPILNSKTNRVNVTLEKSGMLVCLSLDNSVYTNLFLDNVTVSDKMIEIEAVNDLVDKETLNEINDFITTEMRYLTINKQSKYERGINSTLSQHSLKQSQKSNSKKDIKNGMRILRQRIKLDR